jgi:predicted unusual protein kinase regulating ubiquinone biosynthesis (AarF/ABC1/UbiB family)
MMGAHHITNRSLSPVLHSMMEGLGQQLDPDFDIFSVSEPYARELKRRMWLPKAEWGQALLRTVITRDRGKANRI